MSSSEILFDGPPKAETVVVLAHGAGGGMRSDFMTHVAAGLSSAGFGVSRFEFPYVAAGRRAPDKNSVLEAAFVEVLTEVRDRRSPELLVAGGKSMGGRIASQIAAEGAVVDGLVFLGYPLHPPGRPDRIRAGHLGAVKSPMLFVEGTRDPFCPLDTLRTVLTPLPSHPEVAVIADGDHSFKVRKSSGRSTADAWDEVVEATREWLTRLKTSIRA